MPEEEYWESLFDVPLILSRLGLGSFHDVAEFGCGYGTFSIPVAQAIGGTLYAFDIDPEMVARTLRRSGSFPIKGEVRDVMEQGFGVKVDAVLLFNILHCQEPVRLLRQSAAALKPGGQILVIHWRHDLVTPRGPSADTRPYSNQIIRWAQAIGLISSDVIDLPPWHYGLRLERGAHSCHE